MSGKSAGDKWRKPAAHEIEDRPSPDAASPVAPEDPGAAGDADPKGVPTSDRFAAETAHHHPSSEPGKFPKE